MTEGMIMPRKGRNLYFLAGVGWFALSALAFGAYYTGSAPFETLGIPISQLVLGLIFVWIGWLRTRRPIQ